MATHRAHTIPRSPADSPRASMQASKRQIGLVTATALVLGNMIGSGVFLLPASLAPYGGYSLVGWAISAIGALLMAGVFYRLAGRSARAGGPSAYSREARSEEHTSEVQSPVH